MIKRSLYFGNPAYLSLKLNQLVIKLPSLEPGADKDNYVTKTVPIEDVGVVVLDNRQITVTQGLLDALLDNCCAVITCDGSHLPVGLMLPLSGHTVQNERYRSQIEASQPLRKQLWQQTIQCKIANQESALFYSTGVHHDNMIVWSRQVKSGDSDNLEARAAAYYWKNFFPDNPGFIRGQNEDAPNHLLNYGYAVLRAIVARALVMSGLLPTFGIHHHNRYNAYCLADDIMEPYRPYVDKLVLDVVRDFGETCSLTTEVKTRLLSIPVLDVSIDGRTSPLMVAASTTTSSLAKCFSGESRRILYPLMK